jgi:Flp pilus assembly protein TadD
MTLPIKLDLLSTGILRKTSKSRTRTTLVSLFLFAVAFTVVAQTPGVTSLLARARAQEQAGHQDLAVQTWQQVLLVDSNDREAIAGLARAARLAGKDSEANIYLDRLRQLDPNSR